MPFDANGVFSRLYSWRDDRDDGIDILADRHDAEDDNFAAALNLTLLRDGSALPTQNLPMGGKRLTGLGAAVDPNDAVRKQQLDDALSPGTSNIGDFLTTLRNPGSNWLKRDGATRNQVDYPDLFALIGHNFGRPSGFTGLGAITGGANWHDIVYAAGKLVTVGSGGKVSYSTNNGLSWTAATTGVTDELVGITYGAGLFVVVGYNGRIITSPDAVTWTTRTSGTIEALWQVRFGNGTFIAVGNPDTNVSIRTSPDGIAWAPRAIVPFTTALKGVAYGNGTWVAVGDNGTVVSSTDNGANWAVGNAGTTVNLRAVAFGRGRFVAVGNKVVSVSINGSGWRLQGFPSDLQGIAFGSGGFVVTGYEFSASSADGDTWSVHAKLANYFMTGVCYGSDAFYAVENNGKGAKSQLSYNSVTEFQVPADNSDNGYIKAL